MWAVRLRVPRESLPILKTKLRTLGFMSTAKLQSQPSCNGWTFWHVSRNGQDVPIDQFRDEIRAADAAGGDGCPSSAAASRNSRQP